MDDESLEPKLRAIALRVRRFLEPHWWCWRISESRPETGYLSQGTCDRSSFFLVAVLVDAGFEARFVVGAPALGPYGYFAGTSWRGHAWVECQGCILDITCDQFGGPEVRLCPADDPRYAEGEDLADADVVLRREATARRLLARWRATGGVEGFGPAGAPLTDAELRRLCED